MRKYILFLILFFICNISFAEIITLETEEVILGDIVKRDGEGIFVFSGYGLPVKYSLKEIKSIEVDKDIPTLTKDNIQSFYGVRYDVSSLGDDYDISKLIISLADISSVFDVSIEGVKVLESGIAFDLARIALTSSMNETENNKESKKHVLIISPDLAHNPKRMIKVLRKDPLTEKEILDAKVEVVRSDELSSFFGREEMSGDAEEKLSAKIASGAMRLLGGLKSQKKKSAVEIVDVKIYDYYLSFTEMFGEETVVEVAGKSDYLSEDEKGIAEIKTTYYESGKVLGEYSYRNNNLDGISKEYYENGALLAEIEYVNGVRSGDYREYSDDGKLVYVEPYRNGKINGVVKEYSAGEKISGEFTYLDGVLDGSYREYYEDGTLRSYSKYKKGYQEGEEVAYYKSKNVFKRVEYVGGKEDGLYQEFYEGGALKVKMVLEEGIRVGDFKEYFENGTLAYIESYKNGLVDGLAKEFYSDGKISAEITYSMGEIVSQVFYDESGNIEG